MQKQEKNLNIEGLRGIGLFCVVIYHLFIRFPQSYIDKSFSAAVLDNLGFFGVCIFLLLSSYFLAIHKNEPDFKLFQFLKKRILRLWPEYFVGITITYTMICFGGLPDKTIGPLDYFLNAVLVNGFIGTPYVDGAHWYITILIAVILIYSVLLKLNIADKWYVYVVWLVCSAIVLKLQIGIVSMILGGGYVGIICIGVCMAKVLQPHTKKDLLCWGLVFGASCVYLVLSKSILQLICIALAVLCVAFAIKTKSKVLSVRPLVFFGTISYSVYIIHQMISYAIEYHLSVIVGGFHWGIAAIALVAAMMMGVMLHFFVQSIRILYAKQKKNLLKKE